MEYRVVSLEYLEQLREVERIARTLFVYKGQWGTWNPNTQGDVPSLRNVLVKLNRYIDPVAVPVELTTQVVFLQKHEGTDELTEVMGSR